VGNGETLEGSKVERWNVRKYPDTRQFCVRADSKGVTVSHVVRADFKELTGVVAQERSFDSQGA